MKIEDGFIIIPVREYYEFVQEDMVKTGKDMEYSKTTAYFHWKHIHGHVPMRFPVRPEIEKLVQKYVDSHLLDVDDD